MIGLGAVHILHNTLVGEGGTVLCFAVGLTEERGLAMIVQNLFITNDVIMNKTVVVIIIRKKCKQISDRSRDPTLITENVKNFEKCFNSLPNEKYLK